jgi:hypothetical protein
VRKTIPSTATIYLLGILSNVEQANKWCSMARHIRWKETHSLEHDPNRLRPK